MQARAVCEQDICSLCHLFWVLVGNIYKYLFSFCFLAAGVGGPIADEVFSFHDFLSERKEY